MAVWFAFGGDDEQESADPPAERQPRMLLCAVINKEGMPNHECTKICVPCLGG